MDSNRFGVQLLAAYAVTALGIAPAALAAPSIEYIGAPGQALDASWLSPDGASAWLRTRPPFPAPGSPRYWSHAGGLVEVQAPVDPRYNLIVPVDASADGSMFVGSANAVDGRTGVAVRWDASGQVVELAGQLDSAITEQVGRIAPQGAAISGFSTHNDGGFTPNFEAVVWDNGGADIHRTGWLGVSPIYREHSSIADFSADGAVAAGFSTDAAGWDRAAVWTVAGGWEPLAPSPVTAYRSMGQAVSPSGQFLVGRGASDFQQPTQAFLFDRATGATTGLGWLPNEAFGYASSNPNVRADESWSRAVSNDGDLVLGVSSISIAHGGPLITVFTSEYLPFVWTPATGMVTPMDFLAQVHGLDLGGGVVKQIGDVSADGRSLLANGVDAQGAEIHMVIRLDGSTAPMAADFDGDGVVDGGDLAMWIDDFNVGPGGDANGDGVTDGADLLLWQREYRTASAVAATAAIPEPASVALVALLLRPSMRRRRS